MELKRESGINPQSAFLSVLAAIFIAIALSSCNGDPNAAVRTVLGTDSVNGTPAPLPNGGGNNPTPGSGTRAAIGPDCLSDDPDKICLGLKYVVYRDTTDAAIVSELEAVENLRVVNEIYAQCNVAFQIDEYLAARPADYGLQYQLTNYSELDDARLAFGNGTSLLVVSTGTWNRSGSLGNTGANAWAAMPGGSPYGVVLERPVATYSNIIAHELGHYLNLDHYSSIADLMNPIIYSNSTDLTDAQCTEARRAARYYWPKMLR